MQKIGLLGAGHLGKIHIKCLQLLKDVYQLVGFYDTDETVRQEVAKQFGIRAFPSVESLIEEVEVVDIVTPTITHFEVAQKAIKKGKHIFIEKPLTHTIEEAELLVALSEQYGVKVQVGHVERFNPALLSLGDIELEPMFIEAHRLATFNPRGTDVSVVLDLMIHDLDIVLNLVKHPVKSVSASGVSVVSNTPDIANARLEFENGCVANLTASRISLKQMRKVRLFQKDAYISLDFLEKNAQVVRLYDKDSVHAPDADALMELETSAGTKLIHIEMPKIEPVNAIKMELETLAQSIRDDSMPKVSIEDGYKALKVAYQIAEDLSKREKEVKSRES
ncbi:MAG: Gfo/Idh/MocA family oxidoreductase [Bacteroidetes bacterium]|nr:Gfo/Idh/MocA family oxidoreductase [Bacteroidota bacterium]